MNMVKKIVSFLLLFGMIAGIVSGCSSDSNKSPISGFEDLETATIGIITGTNYDNIAKEKFPNAERKYFGTSTDALIALEQGKIDALFADKSVMAGMKWENHKLGYIDKPVDTISNALILKKQGYDETLLAQLNEFIEKSGDNGVLDRLEEKWLGDTEPSEHPDYTKLSGTNGTLKIAVSDSMKPVSYQKGSMYTGYEVDFLMLFAEEYGYKLELQGMAFDALIPSVSSGKCDIGASAITITPERAESVTFTEPHFETCGVALVYDDSSVGSSQVTLADFENASLGVVTGSIYDGHSKDLFPNAKVAYYQTFADLFQCIQQGKIDGFMADEPNYNSVKRVSNELSALKIPELKVEIGYGFQRNKDGDILKAEMDSFIEELKADGTIDVLIDKWYGEEEPTQTLAVPDFLDNKKTISVAVDTGRKPFVYLLNNNYAGFEVEVIYLFCEKFGYRPVFSGVPFASGLAGLSGGKFDLVAGGLYMTEERKQSVNFSLPYMNADVVMVSYQKEENSATFFAGIKESFEKTFLREERWKLVCQGIAVTMIISILSIFFGSLLGFLLYLMSKSAKKQISTFAKIIGKLYSRIMAGTPIVVILMILFYLVFAEFKNLSGIVIAIVGFTLTFGAFVYGHMAVSVDSVDYGQTEAALALGYSKNRTFFRIVLPQAMTLFMPAYCSETVSLIKATAVVGYIAVNDLTKTSDIIRSNTYEAFFPLISTAVIYFVLTWIVASLLNIVKLKFEPKRRNEKTILKGVER